MGSRIARLEKKEETYSVNVDSFIERLKKVRALNCDPSDIGMDSFMWKRFNRTNIITKII